MPAQAQFGERVPVPVTTFSPIATGGVNQQPITSFNYENIGVNIDITPRTHMNNDVTLALAISVTSISGTGFGGLPTFGNRLIKTTIRLKDGETNMLAGLIRDDERKAREGIPGLSDIPGVGRLFGHSRNERHADRRHPHADAAHRARARPDRRRCPRVPDGARPRIGRRDRCRRPGVGVPSGGIELPLPDEPPSPGPSQRSARPQPQPSTSRRVRCMPPAPPPQTAAEPRPGATARIRHASGSASDRGARLRARHGCGHPRSQGRLHLRPARSRICRAVALGFSMAATT